jgi:hypothetical protein
MQPAELNLENFKKIGEGPHNQFYQEIGDKIEENQVNKRSKSIFYHSISKSKSRQQKASASKRRRVDSSSESSEREFPVEQNMEHAE